MRLWQQILLALILGGVVGYFLGEHSSFLKPVGIMFVNMIKMVVVPLVFFSLLSAITSMDNIAQAGRVGAKGFCFYLITTCLAISLVLCIASLFDLGGGVSLAVSDSAMESTSQSFSIADMLISLIPTNPFAAMTEGNILQIILFSILLGVALNLTGDKAKPVTALVHSAIEVMYTLTGMIMKVASIGVFALMAWLTGTQDGALIASLLKVVAVVYSVCIIHIFIAYGGLLMFIGKLSPSAFFKKIVPVQMMAYSTSSSSATLPLTMQITQEKLGVSKATSSFMLPLGTTINMDGTAIYQGVCVVFVAQAMGVDLALADYVTIILTATLASIGTSGIPGAGLIMLSLVLQSLGLPLEGVAVIAGIDRILDMARTTVNVTGDVAVSVVVDKTERKFDAERYAQ